MIWVGTGGSTTNAAAASAVAMALAGVQHVVWFNDSSYFDQVSNSLVAAQFNVPAYLRSLSELWENGYSDSVRKIAFLGVGALAVIRICEVARREGKRVSPFPDAVPRAGDSVAVVSRDAFPHPDRAVLLPPRSARRSSNGRRRGAAMGTEERGSGRVRCGGAGLVCGSLLDIAVRPASSGDCETGKQRALRVREIRY